MKYLDLKRYEGWLISHSAYKDTKPFQRIDYSYKSVILNTSLCSDVSQFNWEMFLNSNENDIYAVMSTKELQKFFDKLYEKFGCSAILEANRLNNARFHRQKRLHDRILRICNTGYTSCFLTFTFTDSVLKDNSLESLRTYVRKWLKSNSFDYVANVDYGAKKGRVHFHAVACASKFDYSSWEYGNLDGTKIIMRDDSPVLMAKYIDKLTLHAIKKTTKRTALIYPKKKY